MRGFLYALVTLAVVGLAFWAYTENYTTQSAQNHAEDLQKDIRIARERLRVLRAEWAYLNRPDRLRELVEINYEKLQLDVLQPHQFGKIDQIAYPQEVEIDFTQSVDALAEEVAE